MIVFLVRRPSFYVCGLLYSFIKYVFTSYLKLPNAVMFLIFAPMQIHLLKILLDRDVCHENFVNECLTYFAYLIYRPYPIVNYLLNSFLALVCLGRLK